jgi:hypothetical protein
LNVLIASTRRQRRASRHKSAVGIAVDPAFTPGREAFSGFFTAGGRLMGVEVDGDA